MGKFNGRAKTVLGALAFILAMFVMVTSILGLPGPGPLRRYPMAHLTQLADEINQHAESFTVACGGPPETRAKVDWLASRVVVNDGGIYGWTPTDRQLPMIANPERIGASPPLC